MQEGKAKRVAGGGALALVLTTLILALEGPQWWAVALVFLSALAMILGLLAWAIARKGTKRVHLGPFEWEGSPDQEEKPRADNPHSPEQSEPSVPRWRRWLTRWLGRHG